MRTLRTRSIGMKTLFTAAIAAALLGATVGGPSVGAAEPGVGTATSDATVLSVELNGLTSIDVLKDMSTSTIDPTVGTPEAFVRVIPLQASGFLSAVTDQLPQFESRSQGASQSTESETLTLPAALAPVASGTLVPASLAAVVDSAGARATLDNAISDLVVGGALLNVTGAGNAMKTDAGSNEVTSARSATLDSLTALDLGSLLAMLGIPLDALPLGTVLELLSSLGLPIDGLSPTAVTNQVVDLANAAANINGVIATLQGASAAQIDDILGPIDDGLDTGGILDPVTGPVIEPTTELTNEVLATLADLGITVPDLTDLSAVQALLDQVLGELTGLLDSALAGLDTLPLVSITDVGVNLGATASDAVERSFAVAEASVGAINVAGVDLPGLDLQPTVDQLNSVLITANGALDTVLGSIGGSAGLPTLADLVDISLLDKTTSVEQVGNYVEALASISVLSVSVTPPAQLGALVDSLVAGTGVADLVDTLGGQLSALPAVGGFAAGDALNDVMGVTALSNGGTARVLTFSAAANFSPDPLAAPPGTPGSPDGELPRTGGTTTLPLLLGAIMIAGAFGTRRWLRVATVN